ncbi:MAG: dipeptide/oligopeptide/nickel ABC transporter ATP-binding protein [Dehalococcoidia bacterium]|nr:dipeptide/oligopeptide/nickel ABC transporter ATP-binding protein [Dehalococcoidia bacterium]
MNPSQQAREKTDGEALLEVRDLSVRIDRDEGVIRPLNGVSFRIHAGQAVGIVGESGCGKTMTSNALLRILPPAAQITSGQMHYRRKADERQIDLATIDKDGSEMRQIRGGDISMIFQEPMTAFSPVHTIHNQIAEMIQLHDQLDKQQARQRVIELLDLVGIPEPERSADDYPFQLSGGMRQRAMIAMALASKPRLLIADEPTTALDVTVQARVLKLIQRLQRELGLALMLITHDLGVVAHTVEYVYVMYLGRIVEQGTVQAIFDAPTHPYTAALLQSIPSLTSKSQRLEPIEGSVPSAHALPAGCPFHTRCKEEVGDICHQKMPAHVEVGPDHYASCFKHTEESV